jgi:hypothetical protein
VKNVFFYPKTDFPEIFFANIYAMSAALSPWGTGFESCFLGKSEVCGIFAVYCENIVFQPHHLTSASYNSIVISMACL